MIKGLKGISPLHYLHYSKKFLTLDKADIEEKGESDTTSLYWHLHIWVPSQVQEVQEAESRVEITSGSSGRRLLLCHEKLEP